MILGFHHGVSKIFAFLRCYTAQIGSYLPTFRDKLSFFLDFSALENGTDKLWRIITNLSRVTSQKNENQKRIFLLQSVQINYEAHPASYSRGTWSSFPRLRGRTESLSRHCNLGNLGNKEIELHFHAIDAWCLFN